MKRLRSTFAAQVALISLLLSAVASCGDDDASAPDANVDASTSPDAGGACARAGDAFLAFVAANRDCAIDDDCTIIGDCGPNADFTAVKLSAASEGRRLMTARCSDIYDGSFYRAACNAGVCTAIALDPSEGCCGCQLPEDAGNTDSGF